MARGRSIYSISYLYDSEAFSGRRPQPSGPRLKRKMRCQPSQQLRQRQRQPQLQLLLSLGVLLGPAVAQHPHPYPQQPRLRQPQPCASALRRLCPASWWASASACSVCAQQNAQTLNQSGCDSAIVARCCAERPPDPPQLPRQSRGQAAAQQRAWAVARTASPAAVPAVVALLDAPPTRSYLRQFDSGDQLYRMPSSALADRIERELNAAELIHNFGNPIPSSSRYKLGCGYDITLDSGAAAPDFYGQWVLQALGLVAVDPTNNLYTERAETNTFGYPPFANVSRPDLLTAADRPVYGAINMFRDAVGNLQCGPIAAVLSKRFVGKSAIAWPVDTGNFGWPACAQQGNWSECFGCSGNADCVQSKPLGAPGAMMHLLLPYLSYYTCANPHSSGPPSCTPHNASYNLARLAIRLLSRSTYAPRGSDSGDSGAASHGGSNGPMVADRPLTLNYAENMFGYFEVNPVATIPMSRQGIKMMIGSFGLLWGTAQGSRLREWSAARGWPLAWAYNPRVAGLCMTGPQPPPAGCLHARTAVENMTEDAVAVRLLDPKVLAQVAEGHNCSNAPAAATFERIWETASNVTSNISLGFGARQTRLRALWRELLQGEAVVNAFGVEPLCKPRHLTPFLMAAPSGVLMLTRVRVSQTTGRAGAWTASACALRTLAVCVPSMRESERDCQRGGSRGAWPIYHCHPPPGRGIEARPSCLPAGARARLAC